LGGKGDGWRKTTRSNTRSRHQRKGSEYLSQGGNKKKRRGSSAQCLGEWGNRIEWADPNRKSVSGHTKKGGRDMGWEKKGSTSSHKSCQLGGSPQKTGVPFMEGGGVQKKKKAGETTSRRRSQPGNKKKGGRGPGKGNAPILGKGNTPY